MVDPVGRRVKDAILNPIARVVPAAVTPNTITLLSLLPGVATAILAAYGMWGWAIAAFTLNRVLDGLDGLLARARALQSDFGGYLDILIDFLVYAIIPIGVWLGAAAPLAGAGGEGLGAPGPMAATTIAGRALLLSSLPLITLLAIFYVNAASWMFLSSVIEKRRAGKLGSTGADQDEPRQTTVEMPTGLVEGTETVVFYFLFLLLPEHYSLLFYLMAAGTAIGVVQRLIWAKRSVP